MMTEPTLSPAMKAAFAKLLRLARVEILDPGDGFLGLTGLSPETRRVHLITHLYEKELAARRAKAQEEALPAIAALVPAQPIQSPVDDPLSGALKYMPSEEFSDPLPPVGICMAAPLEPIPDVEVITPPPPPVVRPSPPVPISPQPGGVPAMPVVVSPMPIDIVKKSIYLKNARANEAYEGVIDVDGLKSLKLEDDGGLGLVLDEISGRLTGRPHASGDFVLRLQGLLYGKRAEITANLAVIPDPKSLWVTKDSDRSDRFWKSDEDFATAEGDLFCVAASKRGRSHAKDGTFRDDDFGLWVSGPGGWHIAVVADGAGSAKYSRRGSKIAVDTVLRALPTMLDEHVTPHLAQLIPLHLQGNPDAAKQIRSQLYQSLVVAAFKAAVALDDEAAAMGEKASAFSTTLIVSVARKVAQGWFIAGFSVGDGGAAVFDVHDASVTPLTLPDSGEFAGQTRFLQKSEFAGGFDTVEKRLFFDIRPTFTAIALMTDGISDPKFPTDAVFADPAKWVDFWKSDLTRVVDFSSKNPEIKAQFLDWLDFWSPGNHDDRTLVVLLP